MVRDEGIGESSPPPGNRGEQLVQVAVEVFHEKGYARASIQDVADRVGMLKGSLYHHIDSKEDLLAAIFEEAAERSRALVRKSEESAGTAEQRLRRLIRSWCLWYLSDVERAGIYVNEWSHLTGERLARVRRDRREYESHLAAMIGAVAGEGAASPRLGVGLACAFVFSAMNGIPAWHRRDGSGSVEPIADGYTEMILGAICSGEGR